MKYTELLASVPLWLIAGTAYAQPLCGAAGVSPSSVICRPFSNAPQQTDIVGGAMANGPAGANTETRFPISALTQTGAPGKFASIATTNTCALTGATVNCGSAAAGAVDVAAGANQSTIVSSTVVTAASQIILQVDQSLGTLLGVTCNTTGVTGAIAFVSARTAGVGFTVNVPGTTASNPVCLSYLITN